MARRRIIANVKPTVAFLCLGLSLGLIQPNLKTETKPPANITITETGNHSRVGTGITITNRDSKKLLEALDYLKKHLDAMQPDDERKRELREIVVDVESELHKSKPNKSKITASLSWILAAIKNVETVKTAYDTISSVLGSLGVHLIT